MSKKDISEKVSDNEDNNQNGINQETQESDIKEEKTSDEEQNKEDDQPDEPEKMESDQKTKKQESIPEEEQPSREDELERLLSELADSKDKYIRLLAEFDNYRRRTLKEKMDMTKTAGEEIILKVLPVIDDFERAMVSMKDANDCNAILDGINLIYNKFKEFLTQQGVAEINAMHEDFDTDVHEALTKIPAPKKKLKGKVVDVVEKGYKLHDKVIRFSKVVIGE